VVIYNEIIEVIRLLIMTFKAYERRRRKQLAPLDGYKDRSQEMRDDKRRGLLISKALIIEAWFMCRPNSGGGSRVNIKAL
jgi:hypothetical protein